MERIKSLGNWLIIILLLIGTAVVAVISPLITQSLNFGSLLGGASRPTTSPAPIVITIPEPVAAMVNSTELILSGAAAFAFLLAVVVALVVGVGIVITIFMRLGDKFTRQVAESEDYQTHVAALGKKEKEKTKARREQQPAQNKPEDHVYGLDPVSFSLVVLFFVALFAVLIYALAVPTGEITILGQTFYSVLPILIALFVITIPLLAWRVRRSRLDAIAENDDAPAPWDFVVVLLLGLLVVGVGIGLMIFINRPA